MNKIVIVFLFTVFNKIMLSFSMYYSILAHRESLFQKQYIVTTDINIVEHEGSAVSLGLLPY